TEHDMTLVRRHRPRVTVDLRDCGAQDAVEISAPADDSAGSTRRRCRQYFQGPRAFDHELHRFGLIHGRIRTGTPRQDASEARWSDRFGGNRSALRDGDGRLRNAYHIIAVEDGR